MQRKWLLCFVIILLVGCRPEEPDDSLMAASEKNIKDYLVANIGSSAFGGEVFCAYELLNAEQGAEGKVYLWALCQEYYPEQESLIPGSGVSLPVALQIQEKNGRYDVIDHLIPRDGTYYGSDVRTVFPQSAWSQILPQGDDELTQYNHRANELEKDTEMQARLSALPHSMKGYELYSWQDDAGQWHFTLMTGTNRIKSVEEILRGENIVTPDGWVRISVQGLEAIKDVLGRLPQSEEIFWDSRLQSRQREIQAGQITLPPQEVVDALIEECRQLGLALRVN